MPTSATASTPSAPAAPAPPEPFKFGADAPEWARGKSAHEVLGIASKLVATIGAYGAPAAPVAQPAAQPASQVGDEDYITGAQLKQALTSLAAQAQPAVAQGVELGASANLAYVRQAHADTFRRYGPEVAQKLAGVPKHMWTLDNLETVVKLVKVDHLDEIARESAQQLVSSMEPTIRSSGAGSSTPVPDKDHSLESERIPVEWKKRALAAGITENVVREFCQANEMTPAQFYAQFDHLGKYEGSKNPIVGDIGRGKATSD